MVLNIVNMHELIADKISSHNSVVTEIIMEKTQRMEIKTKLGMAQVHQTTDIPVEQSE